jgi:hypothetical protein
MGVPGFTAEASLRESKYSYRTLLGSNGLRSNARNPVVATLNIPLGILALGIWPPEPVSCLLREWYCSSHFGSVFSCEGVSPYDDPHIWWIGCNRCCYQLHFP